MKEIIDKILQESLRAKEAFVKNHATNLIRFAERIASTFTNDGKLLICGNGGSAADAQHMAAELVNRFTLERPPLPAMALTADCSVITSIGNDYSFDEIFAKQVKALGSAGDILLAISTSGNAKNVLSAVKAANALGMYTAGLVGRDGGVLVKLTDTSFIVDSTVSARIQEVHVLAEHILCHLVDYVLFQSHLSEE